MSLASPSKPSTVSELSNSSMVSSSSSSTLDSSQFRGSTSGTRTRTRNTSTKPVSDQQKDGKYFERRKRNNVAAKKSRDARKQREDEIAIRASFLEKENSILKAQLQTLKDEAQQLRILLTQKKANQSMGGLMTSACASCSNCMGKQVAQTYVANLNPINNGYESETAINMVDQKMSTTAGQQNATNATGMYLGQANHGQQLNRLFNFFGPFCYRLFCFGYFKNDMPPKVATAEPYHKRCRTVP
ncbi:D site-binding [Brachionus plicatilis]|uniref:D site-binding n=1 Tax=Brachionus plicatilis TaxID=10195 RepID=A0A3M7RTS3_BRAPC|nr:D site-binding [Brachionus plicatilis]